MVEVLTKCAYSNKAGLILCVCHICLSLNLGIKIVTQIQKFTLLPKIFVTLLQQEKQTKRLQDVKIMPYRLKNNKFMSKIVFVFAVNILFDF